MIRYLYNQQVSPPAPFVHVALRCPESSAERRWLPAQLDSAASRSVLPLPLVAELGLVPVDEIQVEGLGGHLTTMPTFLVCIEIRQLLPLTVEVGGHENEPFVLIGRDIMNQFRIVLDGPGRALEIS